MLLSVTDLVTGFDTDDGRVVAVDGVSFSIEKGVTLGIVGESGCGKSVTALSIMNLLPQPAGKILGGSIQFQGKELVGASEDLLHDVRGDDIGMIFQEPMTALNPVQRIGKQVSEAFLLHQDIDEEEARLRSIEILDKVGIPSPEIRVDEISSSAFGRHEAAGHDCHGPCLRTRSPHRG